MRWIVLLSGVGVAACSSPQLIDTGRVGIVAASALPAPTLEDLSRGQRVHIVGPFDRLTVEVFGLPEFSRQVQVDASGRIALPIAGELNVTGQTPEQVETAIAARLRGSFVRDPRVTVGILETVSQVVTVEGEVRTPGQYPVGGSMTLLRAIARAQGTTEFADSGFVVLFRTVNGRQMAALYDLRAIRQGAYEDPPVMPHDVIHVGESRARRIFPQIISGASLLLSPLITILGNNN